MDAHDEGPGEFLEVFFGEVICHCAEVVDKYLKEVGGEGGRLEAVEDVCTLQHFISKGMRRKHGRGAEEILNDVMRSLRGGTKIGWGLTPPPSEVSLEQRFRCC